MIVAFLMNTSTNGQTDSAKNKIQFKTGVYYTSGLHYYGRTDSLKSSGFFPMAELWLTKNFYITAAPVFVNNAIQNFQYAGTVATAGYQFNDLNKPLAGNFYVVKPFYKDNSQLVQSALKAQVAGTLTLKNKIVNITGGGDVKFSGNVDYGAIGGIDHIFRFILPRRTILVIDPSAFINAGTQQFTKTYIKENSIPWLPGREQTEDVKKFNILSYELSVPVILAKGRFQFLLIPSYVMPQNLILVPNRPDLSEKGENLFYITAGAKVNF